MLRAENNFDFLLKKNWLYLKYYNNNTRRERIVINAKEEVFYQLAKSLNDCLQMDHLKKYKIIIREKNSTEDSVGQTLVTPYVHHVYTVLTADIHLGKTVYI